VEYTTLTRKFRQMFIEVDSDTSLTYVDLFLEPENDTMSNNPETYISIDGLHPSAAGYALWYDKLKPEIATVLSE